MSANQTELARRYCGRNFTAAEIDRIRWMITSEPKPHRLQLSRMVCREFGWLRVDGGLKDMSCRVAMLRMDRDGLITLPPPQKKNGNGNTRPRLTSASDPGAAITLPAGKLGKLSFKQVTKGKGSLLWNGSSPPRSKSSHAHKPLKVKRIHVVPEVSCAYLLLRRDW